MPSISGTGNSSNSRAPARYSGTGGPGDVGDIQVHPALTGKAPGWLGQLRHGWPGGHAACGGHCSRTSFEQDQYLLDGTFVLRWQLHWVAGWDPASGEYRATIADNYGHADVMRGRIDGDRLTFETIGDRPVRLRLVWVVTGPGVMTWRNEMSVGGGPWSLVEEYHCTRPQEEHARAEPHRPGRGL